MSAMKLSELSKALLLAIDEAPQSPRLARCSMLAAALHAKIRQMAVQESTGEPVAWMYDKGDEHGLVTAFNPLTTPGHSGRQNIRPLYTYCRFQNTLVDFRECVAAIEADEDLSDVETDAALDLVTLAAKLVRLMTPKYYGPDLRARIRELEGQLRDEIATNNARLATDDLADEDTQKFCRRLVRENETLRGQLHDEIDANTAFREAGGALPDEDMPTFCARLIRERDEFNAVVADIRNGVLIASSERDVAIAALWSARGTLEEIARPKVVANNVGSLMQEILSDTAKARGAIDAIDRAMAELHRDTR